MQDYTRDGRELRISECDLFTGLDTDKGSLSVTVNDGEYSLRSLTIPSDPLNLLSFIEKQYPGKQVAFAYEAGPTGFGLYDAIVGAGYPCLVVAPGNVPAAPNKRVKTNRLDSKKLASLLSGNQLRGIRVPPEPIRHLRSLVHLRYTYMQDSLLCAGENRRLEMSWCQQGGRGVFWTSADGKLNRRQDR